MIHQPSGGDPGDRLLRSRSWQITLPRQRRTLNEILAANTGQPLEVVEKRYRP